MISNLYLTYEICPEKVSSRQTISVPGHPKRWTSHTELIILSCSPVFPRKEKRARKPSDVLPWPPRSRVLQPLPRTSGRRNNATWPAQLFGSPRRLVYRVRHEQPVARRHRLNWRFPQPPDPR